MHTKSLPAIIAAVILIAALCAGPAAAYLNYNIIWTSSGNQFLEESAMSGIATSPAPNHYPADFRFTMLPSSNAYLITPFTSTINVNGTEPVVRSLFFELKMPAGVSVSQIWVYNGPNLVSLNNVNWAGTGSAKVYTLDMGSYKNMNRGINTALIFYNSQTSNQEVSAYGAGAKVQW
jgi:hypothetical protein